MGATLLKAYERLLSLLIRRRRLFLAGVGVVTVGLGLLAGRVGFDGSVEVYFLDDDPALLSYQRFLRRFQVDQSGVIGVFADDVFTPEVLAAIARVTAAVEQTPHIRRARSLANVRVVRGDAGLVELAPLYERPPATVARAQRLRRRALADPLVRGHLVSRDGRAAAVVYEVAPEGNALAAKTELVAALERIVRREIRGDVRLRHAGAPSLSVAMIEHSQRDLALLGPATFAVVGLLVWLMFRRLSAALIALSAVVLALVWTFGVMGAAGIEINAVSAALVGLILAIGVADAVHLLSHYYMRLPDDETIKGRRASKDAAIRRSAAELPAPCFFTSVTTAGGLLALLVSDLKPIREFGWLAALGVILAFLLTMTVIPAVLALVPAAAPARRRRRARVVSWQSSLAVVGRGA